MEKGTKLHNAIISRNPRSKLTINQMKVRFERIYGKAPTENELKQFKETSAFFKKEEE